MPLLRRVVRSIAHARERVAATRPLRWVMALLLTLVVLSGLAVTSVSAYQGYQLYRRGISMAEDGVQRLRAGGAALNGLARDPLDDAAITTARADFIQAGTDFDQVRGLLDQVPGVAGSVPTYGPKVVAAQHLLPIAHDAARLGVVGCDAVALLSSRMRDPLAASGQGISPADLISLQTDVTQMRALLDGVSTRANHLTTADSAVDPRIGLALAAFRMSAPALRDVLDTAETLIEVAPDVLGIGKPTDYLLEQLDSTELRPGGGFVGSYGILALSGARVTATWPQPMTDVDLIDKPFEFAGGSIAYPPQYTWFPLAASWSLRDSNLDADFPTAAVWAERLYHEEGGTAPVKGVIAITPWLIQGALAITGAIYVPEYHETVTAGNLIDRIHYHQLLAAEGADYVPSPDGHSSLRKRFTSYLFDHFLARVRQVAPTRLADFARLVMAAVRSKDLQIYVNAAPAETLLRYADMASAIEAPAGDSFLTVDANIIADKANNFITYTLQDHITLAANGTAHHVTTLTYAWPRSAESAVYAYGTYYRDYLRVYVPPAAHLDTQAGWVAQPATTAFGRQVWAGVFTLADGSRTTIALTWDEPGAATHDAHGWHYRYLLQKQPGLTWHVDLRAQLPSCAVPLGAPNGWTPGRAYTFTAGGPLTQDRALELGYRC